MSHDPLLDPDVGRFSALSGSVRERIAKVKLFILDVDGVLTDGGLYYNPDGTVAKRFHVHDGLGISLAREFDSFQIAVITGHDHPSVAARMRDLHIDDYFPGFNDKRESFETARARHNLAYEEVAFMGDDWIDIPVMMRAGVPLAVANAQPEVKAAAIYITRAHGGNGAVREAVRLILYCKGYHNQAFATWLKRYG